MPAIYLWYTIACLTTQCPRVFQFFQLELQLLRTLRARRGKMTYILTVRSLPPLTILSATKSTQYTSSVCPGRSVFSLYVLRSQICVSAIKINRKQIYAKGHTFTVLSLLALINIRESALQARRYTAPIWPLSVATNLPVRPSQTRTLLSHAALAAHRPSGLNATCATCRW